MKGVCMKINTDKFLKTSPLIKPTQTKKRLCRDFSLYTKRLKNASIENKSFEYILKEYDYNEALFYLDPPYVGTENYYKNTGGFGLKEHELLCNLL
ncbi:hypothetical protein DPU38_07870, partial [Campylobacter jejuni]|nr:hypothetical protein [Campylobacter jejuni]